MKIFHLKILGNTRYDELVKNLILLDTAHKRVFTKPSRYKITSGFINTTPPLKKRTFETLNRKFSVFIDGNLFTGCKMGDNPFLFSIDKVPVQR